MVAALTTEAPGWDPLNSAGEASAVAALMAAIVVSITVQISFGQARSAHADPKVDGHQAGALGLAVAPFSLGLLLLATYLYIVLAGIELRGATAGTAQMAANVFSVAGTVFALGAVSLLFTIACVIHDNDAPMPARRSSAGVYRWSILVIGLFLIFGYENAFRLWNPSNPDGPEPIFWPLVALLLWFAPAVVATASSPTASKRTKMVAQAIINCLEAVLRWVFSKRVTKDKRLAHRKVSVVLFVAFVVPAAVSMAMVSYGPGRSWCEASLWASVLAPSAWFSIGTTAMLHRLTGVAGDADKRERKRHQSKSSSDDC